MQNRDYIQILEAEHVENRPERFLFDADDPDSWLVAAEKDHDAQAFTLIGEVQPVRTSTTNRNALGELQHEHTLREPAAAEGHQFSTHLFGNVFSVYGLIAN